MKSVVSCFYGRIEMCIQSMHGSPSSHRPSQAERSAEYIVHRQCQIKQKERVILVLFTPEGLVIYRVYIPAQSSKTSYPFNLYQVMPHSMRYALCVMRRRRPFVNCNIWHG